MSPAALADAILVVHAAFVVFVVGGLVAIWVGAAHARRFALNPWFRGFHLAAIAFVAASSLLGFMCPLTVWEDALRGTSADKGFVARWLHAWMFWDWPGWVFNSIYVAFGVLTAWLWLRYPPKH